jgi:hypothetical protein
MSGIHQETKQVRVIPWVIFSDFLSLLANHILCLEKETSFISLPILGPALGGLDTPFPKQDFWHQ